MSAEKVAKWRSKCVVNESGCWVWQGRKNDRGYSWIEHRYGHRAMFEALRGPIPDGLELDHTCENPSCVNPDHLDPVTRLEHARRTQDRLGKNHLHRAAVELRQQGKSLQEIADALGWECEGSAWSALEAAKRKGMVADADLPKQKRLTDVQRVAIVAMRKQGATFREIGEAFGIHTSHAARVAKGQANGRQARTAA